MTKFLILILMVAFPTLANTQESHSLSESNNTDIPDYSWERPNWSEGTTKGFNPGPSGNMGTYVIRNDIDRQLMESE